MCVFDPLGLGLKKIAQQSLRAFHCFHLIRLTYNILYHYPGKRKAIHMHLYAHNAVLYFYILSMHYVLLHFGI